MRISVDLINSYLEKPLETIEMVDILERTEVEVEEIMYATKLDSKIIVAKVLEVSKHPDADRLKLVKVETVGGVVDVVCGAPNVRPGLIVAFAQTGAILPDGTEIAKAKIRGELSHGMLCSELELSWGDGHDGIIELDPSLPIGQSLCDIAKITDILDIKTPSNRWDYLSYIGLAREISAFLPGNQLVEPENRELAYQNREVVKVKEKSLCPAFISARLGIKVNTESPRWLVDNLQSAGMRSVNPVVDITNFVMLETGQPSHAYDVNKIEGTLGVRFAGNDEAFTTLDNKHLRLTKNDLVVVDSSGPIALAGVMGGQKTETDTNTREIILEVANFDKTATRRSALRHGLRTESSARFERGLPLPLPILATNRMVVLLQEICGAELIDSPALQQYIDESQKYLGMRIRKAEKFLGYQLGEKEILSVLSRRGFKPSRFSFSKEVKAYLDRPYMYGAQIATEKLEKFDCSLLTQHIYAKAGINLGRTAKMQFDDGMEVPDFGLKPGDLLFMRGNEDGSKEEIGHVGMVAGNNKVLQASSTQKKVVLSPITKFTKANNYAGARRYVDNFNHIISVEVPWWRGDVSMEVDLFEEIAKALGYDCMPEAISQLPSMDTTSHLLLPSLMQLRSKLSAIGLCEVMTYSFVSRYDVVRTNGDLSKNLQIENPLNSEQDYLRGNMLASHLNTIKANQNIDATIFEISRVYKKVKSGVEENWKIAISICGQDSLLRLKGVIDKLWAWYGLEPRFDRLDDKNYISNRSAIIGDYGSFGQLGRVLSAFSIKEEVSYAEINIEKLVLDKSIREVRLLPAHQLVTRDITVEVSDGVWWQEIVDVLPEFVLRPSFKGEFVNSELARVSRKRVSFTVEFDLGATPEIENINQCVEKCYEALRKIPKTQVV